MSDRIERLLLHDSVDRDTIDDATQAIDCRLINVIPASETHPEQLLYACPDRQGFIYLIEDGRLGVTYLAGAGESAHKTIALLSKSLPHHNFDDIDELLKDTDDNDGVRRALGLAALSGVDEPSELWLQAFLDALNHKSAARRASALVATTYVLWSALHERIEEIAVGDEEALVRSHALSLLELYTARQS